MTENTQSPTHDVLTMEALDEDWWHAVYLPLPESPAAELIEDAHFAAQNCFFGARMRIANPEMFFPNISEPKLSDYAPRCSTQEHAEAALEKQLELERRWPEYTKRLTSGLWDVPESIEALREELQREAQERSRAEDAREDKASGLKPSEEEARTQLPDTSADHDRFVEDCEPDHSNDDLDMDFSRGPGGRGR